jgi:hypothetical protein
VTTRRLPAPWRVEKMPGGYVVRDANGQALAYIYSQANEAEAIQAKVLTEDEARRIAANICETAGAADAGGMIGTPGLSGRRRWAELGVRATTLSRNHRAGRSIVDQTRIAGPTPTAFLPVIAFPPRTAYLRHCADPGPHVYQAPIAYHPRSLCASGYLPADARSAMMVLKVAFRPDPRALTTPTIATEIPATIRPYSIAVAPDSSRRNSAKFVMVLCSRPVAWRFAHPIHSDENLKNRLTNFERTFQFPARFLESSEVRASFRFGSEIFLEKYRAWYFARGGFVPGILRVDATLRDAIPRDAPACSVSSS